MNEFVLLLWASDVVMNMQAAAIMSLAVLFFVTMAGHIIAVWDIGFYKSHSKKLVIVAAFYVFVTLLPSPTTIQTYAALSATKDIAETQIGKKALAALEAKFDDIIEGSCDE